MDWIKYFPAKELPEGSRKVIQVGMRRVLVLHFKGEFFAIESNCPHMRYPLKDGYLTEDCGIICPFHHSAFDLHSGDVKEWAPWPPGIGPLLGRIVRQRVLAVFPVKVEDGYVWVSGQPKNV
jgi:nitrite reductase/ring-hydroxylating ferredoxin subunit